LVAPAPQPSVYRTRAHRTRQRVLYALAAVGLVLLGYLLGRWQDTPAPAAAPLPAAVTSAPAEAPSAAAPTTEAPKPTVYPTLQAEAANGLDGVQAQDTSDEGGGQNVGFIAAGDAMRFDNFDFGPVPATTVDVRVSSDADGGQMEIRLDARDAEPIGTLRVTRTGGWQNWRTDEVTLTPVTGVHTIYLTFSRPDNQEFININWLKFGH
jgi:hypothetical protein